MGKLLTAGVTAVVLFSASAGVSWYLRQMQASKGDAEHGKATEPESTHGKHAAPAAPTSPLREPVARTTPSPSLQPAVRPPYNPEAEGAVQIATSLKERLDAVHAREEQLNSRQQNLELIFQDLRSERTGIDDKRRQVTNLLKAVEEKMAELDRKAGELEQKRQETTKEAKQLKKSVSEYKDQEKERIKQVASMYDTMEPASAAKILQTLADSGNLDTAVKILASMRERQAAKVLSELGDPSLAAQLVDKLRGLKKPGQTAPK
jgi:flagellar motility protein MotE (MotC chaperone)